MWYILIQQNWLTIYMLTVYIFCEFDHTFIFIMVQLKAVLLRWLFIMIGGIQWIPNCDRVIGDKTLPLQCPVLIGQWFLTWVRSNPRGSVCKFQGFGGNRFWAIKVKKQQIKTHILLFQQRRIQWMHVWNLWGSVPRTRLRTTVIGIINRRVQSRCTCK